LARDSCKEVPVIRVQVMEIQLCLKFLTSIFYTVIHKLVGLISVRLEGPHHLLASFLNLLFHQSTDRLID